MSTDLNYRGRSAEEILQDTRYFDSVGHLFRAVSWLDHFNREPRFTTLLYCSVEARMGIEHLLFEELVLATGARLGRTHYEQCVKDAANLDRLLRQLCPNHEKLQDFTRIVVEVQRFPGPLVFWEPKQLRKSWGKLSELLHWVGAAPETTQNKTWLSDAGAKVGRLVQPIWAQLSSGPSGLLSIESMPNLVRSIWDDFRHDKINLSSARARLKIAHP